MRKLSTRRRGRRRSGGGGRSTPPSIATASTPGWRRRWAEVEAGREARFAVLTSAGEAIGSTSFCDLRPADRAVEVGWTWFTPSAWGTGANAECKLLLMRHAFERLGCRRVEFHTDELNERSRAALEALPARLDGVLREVKWTPSDRWRSTAVYSVLADEWSAVERQLAARVASQAGA